MRSLEERLDSVVEEQLVSTILYKAERTLIETTGFDTDAPAQILRTFFGLSHPVLSKNSALPLTNKAALKEQPSIENIKLVEIERLFY
ncbi:MAG: hypothetical protein WA885_07805 [Phormidesmis sp.]